MPQESNQIDRSPGDLLKYSRFDEKEIICHWSKDWWDGPMNGLISYRGQRYWFEFYCDTHEPGNPYYYLVFPLTEKEANLADAWSDENERFRQEWMSLGNDPATKHMPSTREIEIRWHAHEHLLPNFTDREPGAWFTSGSNSSFYGVQLQKI